MRKTLLAGALVAVAVAIAIWVGALFGLELESVALLGVALGAVVALVPDGRPGFRLAGFSGGIVVTMIGYFIRAAALPDTTSGRAIAAFIMLALCAVVAGVSVGRIPLWTTLVGGAAFFGAYEAAYAVAPPEVASTSVSTLTTLLLTAASGFLAASFVAAAPSDAPQTVGRHSESDDDKLMERAA